MYNIEDIKRIAVPIAQKYGVTKLALFGSYARGENTENSDIDFIIEKGEVTDLISFCQFAEDLEENLLLRVDMLTYQSLPQSRFFEMEEVILYEE